MDSGCAPIVPSINMMHDDSPLQKEHEIVSQGKRTIRTRNEVFANALYRGQFLTLAAVWIRKPNWSFSISNFCNNKQMPWSEYKFKLIPGSLVELINISG